MNVNYNYNLIFIPSKWIVNQEVNVNQTINNKVVY